MPEAASPPSAPTRRPPVAHGSTRQRAVTRRVPRRPANDLSGAEEDGSPDEAAPEPNMRLSRAVVVMLLLHVVAVGGVLAFGLIKEGPTGTGRGHPAKPNRDGKKSDAAATSSAGTDHAPTPFPFVNRTVAASPSPAAAPPAARAAATPALSRVEADAVRLIEGGGPNALGSGERSYVVGRGETLQAIAQKLRVEPATLLRLNNVDDPRKIQAGQRLRVPPPTAGRTRS